MAAGQRLLFIDSDAFVLLSAAGLLDLAIAALGFATDDARRLQPLPFMLARPRGTLKTYPPEIRAAAIAACDTVAAVQDAPTDQSAAWVTDANNVDSGEALLVGLMLDQPTSVLLTGDKRALTEIGTNQALAAVAASLAGRVVCVEALLRLLVSTHGVASIGKAVDPIRSVNNVVRVCFTADCIADQAKCLVAIEYYFNDLDGATGGAMLWR